MNQKFSFKGFHNLDDSPDADYLITSMDVMFSIDSIKEIKKRSIEALDLQPGSLALEAGCGHGEDAELMADIIGKDGAVIAIDNSQRMLDEAKQRSTHKNVEYQFGDINNLPFHNDTFAACHADRLLVSQVDFNATFKELLRVVKPGGKLSITDVDALSIVIHPFSPITKLILEQLHSSFINPYIGRQLHSIFMSHGMQRVRVFPEICTIRSYNTLNKIFLFKQIIHDAMEKEKITQDEATEWDLLIRDADQKGEFLYAKMLFTVIGEKSEL